MGALYFSRTGYRLSPSFHPSLHPTRIMESTLYAKMTRYISDSHRVSYWRHGVQPASNERRHGYAMAGTYLQQDSTKILLFGLSEIADEHGMADSSFTV